MNDRAAAARLGVGAILFAALTLFATFAPTARVWGLHMPAYLPPFLRYVLLIALCVFAGVTMAAGIPRRAAEGATATKTGRRPVPDAKRRRHNRSGGPTRAPRIRGAMWVLALPAVGATLWLLRARTQLLGDGGVWLGNAETGSLHTFNEPLFAVIWHLYAGIVRTMGLPIDSMTMAIPSILAGLAAVGILAGIAAELAEPGPPRALVTVLLAGLGSSAYYFGYIESYPVASVFLLGYLWLGLRAARDEASPLPAGLALGAAIAVHLSLLYLLPSFGLLALRKRGTPLARIALALVPIVTAVAILAALGFAFSEWRASLEAAFRGMRESGAGDLYKRPYGPLSLGHAIEIANAFLLVAAAPLLLLIARGQRVLRHGGPAIWFLAAAAAPGLTLACGILTPIAAAQDWDLYALFLLPFGVLGIACGTLRSEAPLPERSIVGVAGLALVSVLGFVFVQASEAASVARFGVVVNDRSAVSRYGRAYGNSLLDRYYRERGAYERALPYAQAALEAERGNPRYWINVGTSLYLLGRIDEATPVFEQAVRLGPEFWPAQSNLALCYIARERYAEAVAPLRAAWTLDSSKPETLHDLGLAFFKSGHPDSAYAIWADLAAKFPGYNPGAGAPPER